MSNSLVSVVVPTFNRAHLLRDALDSVNAQDHRPLEIIVVDDGSVDDTASVVALWSRAHAEVPVRYIRQENSGGNVARNRGIAEACGDFVAFLDSDDRWAPDKIKRQVARLSGNPALGAVYCGVLESVVETGETMPFDNRPWPEGRILKSLLVRDVTAPTSAWLVRRKVLDRAGGFDETLEARQDWDLWIRIAKETEIGAIKAPLAELRHHEGERTNSNIDREIRSHRRILQKYAEDRKKCGVKVRLAALSAFHRRAGRVAAHHRRKPLLAMAHYLGAVAYWPLAWDNYAALMGLFLPGSLRSELRIRWNKLFGESALGIRNH